METWNRDELYKEVWDQPWWSPNREFPRSHLVRVRKGSKGSWLR
jgi:hypothetical protein